MHKWSECRQRRKVEPAWDHNSSSLRSWRTVTGAALFTQETHFPCSTSWISCGGQKSRAVRPNSPRGSPPDAACSTQHSAHSLRVFAKYTVILHQHFLFFLILEWQRRRPVVIWGHAELSARLPGSKRHSATRLSPVDYKMHFVRNIKTRNLPLTQPHFEISWYFRVS